MPDLPKTMRALVVRGRDQYEIEEVDTPRAGEGEIIIKIEGCGICAGDAKAFHGADRFWGGSGMEPSVVVPFIPGHEFLGHVAEIGPHTSGNFKIGDRITSEQIVPCWECRFCKSGRYWMCQRAYVYGFRTAVNGGFAEYMRLPKGALNYRVPDALPFEAAILIEPYGCAKHAVDRAQVNNEDIVVQAGAGCLGLGMVSYLSMKNPKKIVVLDMKDDRLRTAKEFGADIVLNPAKDDVKKIIMDLTDGYGCDVYIEATGHPDSVIQGMDLVRRLGRFVEFSVFGAPVVMDWSVIGDVKELDVLGAHLSPYCFEPVIEWLGDNKLKYNGVVTHTYRLEDWEEAFEIAATGKDNANRVAIKP
jgi:Threonine dehydrogenase and related Zn-dependent dehydrogenases